MPFSGLNVVPNPYVPENTIICGPRTYERLTKDDYEKALERWRKARRDKGKLPAPTADQLSAEIADQTRPSGAL